MKTATLQRVANMREATAPQQFIPIEAVISPTVDAVAKGGPISAARLAKLEKKKRSHFSTSKEALQPVQPNAPPLAPAFLALELVTKPNLTTAETAYYLNRRPQTLRVWACLETGPVRPIRIGGLLAWNTATIKALTGSVS
jgi:hypothetical protein